MLQALKAYVIETGIYFITTVRTTLIFDQQITNV